MSLTRSLLATVAIFTLVWGAVFLNTSQYRSPDSLSNAELSTQIGMGGLAEESGFVQLVGISKDINLDQGMDEVNTLWQQFDDFTDLHMAIGTEASKTVYGYYRFKGSDLGSAQLVIGYNNRGEEIDEHSIIATVSSANYEKIFESQQSWDTTPAWSAIDTDRAVDSLLEEYTMGGGGEIVSTKVYVLYQ